VSESGGHRARPTGATGVLDSLGGPGGTGRTGSGRTRGASSDEMGLSGDGPYARGDAGVSRASDGATD
jgi:hypothetical protein